MNPEAGLPEAGLPEAGLPEAGLPEAAPPPANPLGANPGGANPGGANLPEACLEEALAAAVARGSVREQLDLLERGADPSATAANGQPVLFEAIRSNRWDSVEALLNAGGNRLAERPSRRGDTAVHHAAWTGRTGMLRGLLARMPFYAVNLQTPAGDTPLHHAVCAGHAVCVRVLLEHNADVTLSNIHGHSAIQMLALFDDPETLASVRAIRKHVVRAAAEQFERAAEGGDPEKLAEFARAGFPPKDCPEMWSAALEAAAARGDEDLARWLLRAGARSEARALRECLSAPPGAGAAEIRARIAAALLHYGSCPDGPAKLRELAGQARQQGLGAVAEVIELRLPPAAEDPGAGAPLPAP